MRKILFVRWLPGTRYVNAHVTTPIELSEITGVLLHFKFLQDFSIRVHVTLNRKENPVHGGSATELFAVLYEAHGKSCTALFYPGSMAYQIAISLSR